jgi:hypothetical protein
MSIAIAVRPKNKKAPLPVRATGLKNMSERIKNKTPPKRGFAKLTPRQVCDHHSIAANRLGWT